MKITSVFVTMYGGREATLTEVSYSSELNWKYIRCLPLQRMLFPFEWWRHWWGSATCATRSPRCHTRLPSFFALWNPHLPSKSTFPAERSPSFASVEFGPGSRRFIRTVASVYLRSVALVLYLGLMTNVGFSSADPPRAGERYVRELFTCLSTSWWQNHRLPPPSFWNI